MNCFCLFQTITTLWRNSNQASGLVTAQNLLFSKSQMAYCCTLDFGKCAALLLLDLSPSLDMVDDRILPNFRSHQITCVKSYYFQQTKVHPLSQQYEDCYCHINLLKAGLSLHLDVGQAFLSRLQVQNATARLVPEKQTALHWYQHPCTGYLLKYRSEFILLTSSRRKTASSLNPTSKVYNGPSTEDRVGWPN